MGKVFARLEKCVELAYGGGNSGAIPFDPMRFIMTNTREAKPGLFFHDLFTSDFLVGCDGRLGSKGLVSSNRFAYILFAS